mgnify:CR=1 FL=1
MTIHDYHEDYKRHDKIYWSLSDINTSFLKAMSDIFSNTQIKDFLKSVDPWTRHCLTEKKNRFTLINYRGFNVHFNFFKPKFEYSNGFFYDEKRNYYKSPYYFGCCIVTFSSRRKINGLSRDVFVSEHTIELNHRTSWKARKACADILITKYKSH